MELTKGFVLTCRRVNVLRDFLCQAMDQVEEKDRENAELKQKLEDAKASAYTESVDASMRERKLKRGLWHAREWRAWCEEQFWLVINDNKPRDIYHLLLTIRIHRTPSEWIDYWYKVEQLCGKKAEEYK